MSGSGRGHRGEEEKEGGGGKERWRGRNESERWQHDMFGPEEAKQRGSEAESGREGDGGRRRETSHVQSHSPLGCTRQHTLSIIWLRLSHAHMGRHTRTRAHIGCVLMAFYIPHLPIIHACLTCRCSPATFLKEL